MHNKFCRILLFDSQAAERRAALEKECLAEQAQRVEEARAAQEYEEMIRREAKTMTQRGYIPRVIISNIN